jgi:hypothetical protein
MSGKRRDLGATWQFLHTLMSANAVIHSMLTRSSHTAAGCIIAAFAATVINACEF